MTDANQAPEWLRRCKPVDGATVDVGYLIVPRFYFGPETSFSREQWERMGEPLVNPDLPRYGDFVLSGEIVGREEELLRYYRHVLDLCRKHGRRPDEVKYYFWIRPLIFKKGDFAITFPWYDSIEESERLISALSQANTGQLFDDIDQGWSFEAYSDGAFFYMRQSDPDACQEHFVVKMPASDLTVQFAPLLQRVRTQVRAFSEGLGCNMWSATQAGLVSPEKAGDIRGNDRPGSREVASAKKWWQFWKRTEEEQR